MQPNTSAIAAGSESRRLAWINFGLAVMSICAMFVCFYIGNLQAQDAVRRYGHNVDSGFYLSLAALIACVPASIFFALVAAAFARGWRARWWLQVAAATWALLSGAWVSWVGGVFGAA